MAEYKAILFDVGGTLADKKRDLSDSVFILRSETLPQTLEELSRAGVKLFMVSVDSYTLMRQGLFREGLLKPVAPNGSSKLGAFDRILKENGLKPNEVLAIGDDELSEGSAAQTLGITFVKVSYFLHDVQVSGSREELENKLRNAFPSIFAKKDVMSDASGLKRRTTVAEHNQPRKKLTT